MEMPEIGQRKPDPGSPNVQTRPASDPRPNPILPPRSSWKRLRVVQWIMLGTLLLAITVGAAENVPVEEASMLNHAEPEAYPDSSHNPGTKENAELCTNVGPCPTTTEPTINICETPECKQLDSDVQDKMNRTMDPCDDFYNYACGGFLKKTPFPREMNNVNILAKAVGRLYDEMSALINSSGIRANDTMPFRLVKRLYQQCMIRPPINQSTLSMLAKLGGWYLLEEGGWAQPEPSWSLVESVDDLRSHGHTNDYFIRPSVEPDWKNTSRRMIYIDNPPHNINSENIFRGRDDPDVSDYYDYMVNTTASLGADKERAEQDLRDLLDLEIALANISLSYEERQNATALYNTTTVQDLQREYPFINWLDYFRVVFKDTGIVIDKNETVIVKSPSYFNRLGTLLQTTSNRTLVNYVMWRVVEFLSPSINMNLPVQPQTKLSAEEEQQHRSMKCVKTTMSHLPIAVAAQYVKGHVNGDSRSATVEMANELRNAFVEILNENDWMDKIARNSCLEKVNSMAFHIGYPDELLDDSKIDDYYRDLEPKLLSTDDYLSADLYIKQFNTMQNFKMLRKPVNKTDWTTHSTQTDFSASYSSSENSVQMSTSILQALFLPDDLPRYMNYGAIGPTIGSLITGACDYRGRKWDKNGNPENWWQADTERAYLDKRKCYIDQYDNYTEPSTKLKLDGRTTAEANIGDHSGYKVTYRAYKNWAKNNRRDPRLPRLKLSPERMFWLSAAQGSCSKYRPETMRKLITLVSKVPGQFQVLGAMRNMVEFSEDFNCPSGSPMNRTEKCKVW